MRILAISGSLRAESTNTALVRALGVDVYEELARIPPFNPDVEDLTGVVERFRAAVAAADVVVFSTPEYAHGVPGSLKNALDWIVGSGELSGKRVALLNASSRGVYAQESLKEILKTMNAVVLHEAEMTIDLIGKKLSPAAIAEQFAAELAAFQQSLAA